MIRSKKRGRKKTGVLLLMYFTDQAVRHGNPFTVENYRSAMQSVCGQYRFLLLRTPCGSSRCLVGFESGGFDGNYTTDYDSYVRCVREI